jgi:hypothetical protein
LQNKPIVLLVVILAFSLLCSNVHGGVVPSWIRTYGPENSQYSFGECVIKTENNAYVMLSQRSNEQSGNSIQASSWLTKVDNNGNTLWDKEIGLVNSQGQSVIEASEGGFIIVYFLNVIKVDSNCNILWNQTYADPDLGYIDFHSICKTNDGGYLLGATVSDSNPDTRINGNTQTTYEYPDFALLIKIDSNGNIVWKQTYSIDNEPTSIVTAIQTSDGNYALVGTASGQFTGTSSYIWFAKTDNLGNLLFVSKHYASDGNGEVPTCMIQTTDGGYLVGGWFVNSSSSPGLMKIDSNGSIQWVKNYGNDSYNMALRSVIQTTEGKYVFAGYFGSDPSGGTMFWLCQIDYQGKIQWEHFIPGNGYDTASKVVQSNDGGYLIVGDVGTSGNTFVPCLLKTDENGVFSGTFLMTGMTANPTNTSISNQSSGTTENNIIILMIAVTIITLITLGTIIIKRKK